MESGPGNNRPARHQPDTQERERGNLKNDTRTLGPRNHNRPQHMNSTNRICSSLYKKNHNNVLQNHVAGANFALFKKLLLQRTTRPEP